MANLLTLAKNLDFDTEAEYFDYCIESFINGNYSQCSRLFKEMTKMQRKELLRYIRDTDMNGAHSKVYQHYFNLL